MAECWKNGYHWSKDYARLQELLNKGYEVICRIDWDFKDGSKPRRDICSARFLDNGQIRNSYYSFDVRGLEYLHVWRDHSFAEEVKALNVEFLEIDAIQVIYNYLKEL